MKPYKWLYSIFLTFLRHHSNLAKLFGFSYIGWLLNVYSQQRFITTLFNQAERYLRIVWPLF